VRQAGALELGDGLLDDRMRPMVGFQLEHLPVEEHLRVYGTLLPAHHTGGSRLTNDRVGIDEAGGGCRIPVLDPAG
jgi:hypothetical protein